MEMWITANGSYYHCFRIELEVVNIGFCKKKTNKQTKTENRMLKKAIELFSYSFTHLLL